MKRWYVGDVMTRDVATVTADTGYKRIADPSRAAQHQRCTRRRRAGLRAGHAVALIAGVALIIVPLQRRRRPS
jgi:hypothetical protein